jgi:hypothetical protein
MLVDPANLRRRPVAHVPDVRNDPRTRPQVRAQLLPQLQVWARVQEERHDGRRPDVRRIHVAEPELDFVLDTRFPRLRLRLSHQCGIDLNPHATRAKLGCRGNRDAPISGTEIVDDVLRADLSQLQQCAHDGHRRWLEANVLTRDRPAPGQHKQPQDEPHHDLFHRLASFRSSSSRIMRAIHSSTVPSGSSLQPRVRRDRLLGDLSAAAAQPG